MTAATPLITRVILLVAVLLPSAGWAERILITVPVDIKRQEPNVIGGRVVCTIWRLPASYLQRVPSIITDSDRHNPRQDNPMNFELYKGSYVGNLRVEILGVNERDLAELRRVTCRIYACRAPRPYAALSPNCNQKVGEVEGFMDTTRAVTLPRRGY